MDHHRKWLLTCLFLTGMSLFAGCASISSDYDPPVVDVVGVIPDNSSGAIGFIVKLRIVNPNADTLAFNGIFYRLSVEGHDLVTGTANDIAPIKGYSEAEVALKAAPSLLGGISLLADLFKSSATKLNYQLAIKLDVSGHLTALRITRDGVIDLDARATIAPSKTLNSL